MIINVLLLVLFTLAVLGLAMFFLVEIYINLFQAEKLRQLIASQPEYNLTWYMLIKSYKPFKWWHFYRKSLFSWLLAWLLVGKPDPNLQYECVTYRVLPKFIKRLYSIETYFGILFFVGIILFSILNHFSSN